MHNDRMQISHAGIIQNSELARMHARGQPASARLAGRHACTQRAEIVEITEILARRAAQAHFSCGW